MQDAAEKPDGSIIKITSKCFKQREVHCKAFCAHSLFLKNYVTMAHLYAFVQVFSVLLLKCKFLITCHVILTGIAAVYFPMTCSNAVTVVE
jgi:hypothetical protein